MRTHTPRQTQLIHCQHCHIYLGQVFYCPTHAAAPELLEALKFVEAGTWEMDPDALEQIRAAIAKAEGR